MKRAVQRPGCMILAFLLLAGLVSCQAGSSATPPGEPATEPGPASGITPPSEKPPSEAPGPTQPASQSGLWGVIFSESDVTGIPDEPLADEMLLAIPVKQAGEILGGGAAPGDEQLRFLRVRIEQAGPAIHVTRSDAAGNYIFRLAPGEYILCAVNSNQSPPDFPVTTRGCGRMQVPAGEMIQVDISSGFGEILLVEH